MSDLLFDLLALFALISICVGLSIVYHQATGWFVAGGVVLMVVLWTYIRGQKHGNSK